MRRASAQILPLTADAAKIQALKRFQQTWFGIPPTAKRTLSLLYELPSLTDLQKHALMDRYAAIYTEFVRRASLYSYMYHIGHSVVTVGSLIVPALLSIQYTSPSPGSNPQDMSMKVYWITWLFSLLVTTFNGILTLFRVDKKYFLLHTNTEQLQSEITQYIHLSGRYAGYYTPTLSPTHQNQYVYVCHNIEKIKLKQVSEEYYKQLEHSSEESQQGKQGQAAKTVAGMFQPTPTQRELLEYKADIARALQEVDGTSGNAVTKPYANTLIRLPSVDGSEDEASTDSQEKQKEQTLPRRTASASSASLPM